MTTEKPLVDMGPSFKFRCSVCGSTLMRVALLPKKDHFDIYCGVCEQFLAHGYYSGLTDVDENDIGKEMKARVTKVDITID